MYDYCITPSKSFVAIDLENADSAQNICQFGLAVVCDLQITERRSWLIQPPANHYEEWQMKINHITPEDTANAPTLPEVWPEIEPYLRDTEIWAHNAVSVEEPVLEKNLNFHGIAHGYYYIHDSRDLYQRPDCSANKGNGIVMCCMAMGVPCENHHDAKYDACMCAELVIRYLKGQKPDWSGVPTSDEEWRKQQQQKLILHMGEFQAHYAKQQDGSDRNENGEQPDLFAELTSTCAGAKLQLIDVFDKGDIAPKDGSDQVDLARLDLSNDNPLRGKKVVLTGLFHISRKEIERAIEAMGGTKTSGPSSKTNVVLIGTKNVGLNKLCAIEKHCGKGCTMAIIVGNNDLDALLYGDGRKFFELYNNNL